MLDGLREGEGSVKLGWPKRLILRSRVEGRRGQPLARHRQSHQGADGPRGRISRHTADSEKKKD